MNLLVVGNDEAYNECKARLGDAHIYFPVRTSMGGKSYLGKVDAVFDFSESHSREAVDMYTRAKEAVFLNTVFTTLAVTLGENEGASIFGFCGLPTFFNREVLEVSLSQRQTTPDQICRLLELTYVPVKDQVGFITPRVVCMIINEAFDALQNGVASQSDIDLSMKLGTNYPFGPFEWSQRIGVDNVRKLLATLEKSTGDARYRPVF